MNTTPTTTPAIKQQPVQPPLQQQPRLFTEVVKSPAKHCDSVDPETMIKLLNIYEMIRQS